MGADRWEIFFEKFLDSFSCEQSEVDQANRIPKVTCYCVQSFDGDALLFSLPLLIRRPLLSEITLDPAGADGAVSYLIEQVKQRTFREPALGPLSGNGTGYSPHYDVTIEPYTLIHSDDALATHLWHADDRNFCDHAGIHLLVRGALKNPVEISEPEMARVRESVTRLCETIVRMTFTLPSRMLETAWHNSLDQKLLRAYLPLLGLVSFIGDGSRLARSCTRHREFFRVAGPKAGVNVPFTCPNELQPVELELPASNVRVTGLGIRAREVLAVAGSNAQGKTTFLEGVIAGMDDHAAVDGRERVVTVRGVRSAVAMNCGLSGADVSMFFSALPPGVSGTVTAAHGRGSGSMMMAQQVGDAVRNHTPLLIIDEDRAAPNLLVRSCLQKEEITPLSEILAYDRGRMSDTALVFAACAMDTLIAEADRIMLLDRHIASAIDRAAFRRLLAGSLRKTADDLS